MRAQERKAEREARDASEVVFNKSAKKPRPTAPPNMTFIPIQALVRADRAPTTAAASKKASTQHQQRPVASDETDEQVSPILPVRRKRAADRKQEGIVALMTDEMKPSKMQRGRGLDEDDDEDDDEDERSSKDSLPVEEEIEETPDPTLSPCAAPSSGREPSED